MEIIYNRLILLIFILLGPTKKVVKHESTFFIDFNSHIFMFSVR